MSIITLHGVVIHHTACLFRDAKKSKEKKPKKPKDHTAPKEDKVETVLKIFKYGSPHVVSGL